jgi:CRISPR-associated endonuclease/helicase Cas3
VGAPKWLWLEETSTGRLAEMMAARALSLGADGERIVIFCNSRKTAQDVYGRLERALGKQASRGDNIELIVGARRVREREQLANSVVFRRFAHAAKSDAPAGKHAAFLVATSAGEVGVDIDAENMVCDLVAWERMVQRLGRVNRRGEHPESLVDVFVVAPDKEAETPPGTPSIEACREPFESPRWKPRSDGRRDASPAMLLRLRKDPDFRELTEAATTGEALRPALTKTVVDAWSMTSLEAHTGRPQVAPWIRGWIEEEAPQTEVLWRQSLPLRPDDAEHVAARELAAFFDQAPPHLSEILETEAYRVADLLRARAKRVSKKSSDFAGTPDPAEAPEAGDEGSAHASPATLALAANAAAPCLTRRSVVAVVLDRDGSVAELLRLQDVLDRDVRRLHSSFANRRVVFDARLGGLAASGLLDPKENPVPATLDGPRIEKIAEEGAQALWSDERLQASGLGFRVRIARHGEDDPDWRVAYRRLVDAASDEANDIEGRLEWRVEEWVRDRAAENETALAAAQQTVDEHHTRIVASADRIAEALGLPGPLRDVLLAAARYHDSGKARVLWQRFAGNPGFARGKTPALAKFTSRGDPNC